MATVDADTKAKLATLGWTAVADSVDTLKGKKKTWQTTICAEGVLVWSYETGQFYAYPKD